MKKLGYGARALFCSLFLAFSFCLFFKPDFSSLPAADYRLTAGVSLNMVRDINETSDAPRLMCNTKDKMTDVCEINGDIRIDSSSASVLIVSSDQEYKNMSWAIKPHPRKFDLLAMSFVREWTVKYSVGGMSNVPQCNQIHRAPAILFSTGGFAGNNYHDFTDIIIPLFLTARQFNGEVKLLMTDYRNPTWVVRFHKYLTNLSKYEIIKIDEEKVVHCFESAILGLKHHPGSLMIDSSRSPYTMKDFKTFLRNSYSLPKISAIKLGQSEKQSPLLVIIARNSTRRFTNAEEIAAMAKELGFAVVIAEPNHHNGPKVAEIVNSCDVMMGVHGAGLTNMVFLPENAVMIQVVPIAMEWVARGSFEEPVKEMNVRYLEYRIEAEESSLIEQFPPGHEVFSNPASIVKQGWGVFKSVYLNKQNVKVKLNRFRPTLLKALELLHH